ncbi:uncharacterized protein LOC112088905 [Eutrema salsugineum]|uniref:uncharacterized protein LOC112088905 n=1 Tax=Eutrema salsugineum TaxID=72664 RepID=UPI000CED5ABB|nr:uncharacterized protein LOC112088905 [Eutrema salsugineum]
MGDCQENTSRLLIKSPETPGADKSKEATNLKTLKAKDTVALQIIQYVIADTIFDKILSATTTKEACDLLEHSYQGNENVKMVRLQSLRREFENLKMKEGEKVKAYSDRIQSVANQMRALGRDRSNFDLVVKMLAFMPTSYAGLASLMEEIKDLNSVTYAELIGSLEAHAKKYFPDEDEENAEGSFHARFKNQKMETLIEATQVSQTTKKRSGLDFVNEIHTMKKCVTSRMQEAELSSTEAEIQEAASPAANKVTYQKIADREDLNKHKQLKKKKNSICSPQDKKMENSSKKRPGSLTVVTPNHMTPNEKLFNRLDTSFKVPIRVGDGTALRTKGKGDIVSQMIANGYTVTFKHRSCIILDQAEKKIAEVEMAKKSFHLHMPFSEGVAKVVSKEEAESSHHRAGYAENSSETFQKKALVVKGKNQRSTKIETEVKKTNEVTVGINLNKKMIKDDSFQQRET